MTNYYQQSSFEFPLKSQSELDFVKSLGDRADSVTSDDLAEDEPYPMFESLVAEHGGWGWVSEHKADRAVFYTEESANVDAMVAGLQEFLAKFRGPREFISFTWADTCSRPITGAFSGGGIVVTAHAAEPVYVDDKIREIEGKFQLLAEKDAKAKPRKKAKKETKKP